MTWKELEIMSRCSVNFFVKFVKDGPEFDSKGPIDRWQWKFVHDYEVDGEEEDKIFDKIGYEGGGLHVRTLRKGRTKKGVCVCVGGRITWSREAI